MKATINKKLFEITSENELSQFLDEINLIKEVDSWLFNDSQESLCLMKSKEHIFLMYLRYPEDAGFVSMNSEKSTKVVEFCLSNGQVDEYPLSWCISSESAYKALAYFYVNSGEKSPHITWQIV